MVDQIEGFEARPGQRSGGGDSARIAGYDPAWLDALCRTGRVQWMWLGGTAGGRGRRTHAGPAPTPIAPVNRRNATLWRRMAGIAERRIVAYLDVQGASFFTDLVEHSGLLRTQVEAVLGELVARGTVTADGFGRLRALLEPIGHVPPAELEAAYHRQLEESAMAA